MPHKLGQVFLHDKNILNKIIKLVSSKKRDTIVEIGCGDGILSEALTTECKQLHIIEIDQKCIDSTTECLKKAAIDFNKITITHADILKDKFNSVTATPFSVVANIPYYISAKIIKTMIEKRQNIDEGIIMVQDEFAKKCMAKPGDKDYTSFTLYCSYYFDIIYEFKVSKNSFYPVPKVDSAIMTLKPRKTPLFKIDEELFFAMIRTSFWGRRKTLISCLAKGPYLKLDPKFKDCDFFKKQPKVRGETLSLQEFYTLYENIYPFFIK